MKIIKEDLFKLTFEGCFDIIAHGLNCFCTAPYSGIAYHFENFFRISEYGYEQKVFEKKFNKLGNLEFKDKYIHKITRQIIDKASYDKTIIKDMYYKVQVTNAYTQYKPGADLNKIALLMCFTKLSHYCNENNLKLGIPLIGGGIAGGNPLEIKSFMEQSFKNIDATLVVTPEIYEIIK